MVTFGLPYCMDILQHFAANSFFQNFNLPVKKKKSSKSIFTAFQNEVICSILVDLKKKLCLADNWDQARCIKIER